jgi:methylphosphotriester-DNA--protein-cysteine methyltransferase
MIHGCASTGIFCLPTCRYDSRVLEKNRRIFTSTEEARMAGYRPCKVCKPEGAAAP